MTSPFLPRKMLRSALVAVAVGVATLTGSVTSISPAAAANPPVEATICGEPGAAIVRLYRAYFNRVPDQGGLEYWGNIYLQTDLNTVGFYMAQSPEFIQRWQGSSDREFVEQLLYQNLLNRDPDSAGFDYWVDLISQVERTQQVVFWVAQDEFIANHPVVDPPLCNPTNAGFRAISGGRAIEVDVATANLKTSAARCSVASINANWLYVSGSKYGQPIGFSTIQGTNGPGANTAARGIFGMRSTPSGAQAEFEYSGMNMLSNMMTSGNSTLQLHSNWWETNPGPYDHRDWLDVYRYRDHTEGWEWAAGGITLVSRGQEVQNITQDTYTFNTRAHSFVAFRAPSTVIFGSTTNMNTRELINWLASEGYTDIMKMDGGGSVEFNEYGTATVAGTARPIPVWLGVGC